jgi:hypothetical protein
MRHALIGLSLLALAGLPAAATTIETRISEEFQEKLEDDYGVREAEILTSTLAKKVEQEFARKGVAPARVVLTIEDAQPNRPTFGQLSDRPGLDGIRSISIGGAHVTGVAYDAAGAEIATLDYDWYETDIDQVIGAGVWHDARWAFNRFARRFAEQLG